MIIQSRVLFERNVIRVVSPSIIRVRSDFRLNIFYVPSTLCILFDRFWSISPICSLISCLSGLSPLCCSHLGLGPICSHFINLTSVTSKWKCLRCWDHFSRVYVESILYQYDWLHEFGCCELGLIQHLLFYVYNFSVFIFHCRTHPLTKAQVGTSIAHTAQQLTNTAHRGIPVYRPQLPYTKSWYCSVNTHQQFYLLVVLWISPGWKLEAVVDHLRHFLFFP